MMRLSVLDTQTPWWVQLEKTSLGFSPGPTAVMHYRPEFFGQHFKALIVRHLRASAVWTAGELELMAAFVSARNQCDFCAVGHGAVAALHVEHALVEAVLADWQQA